MRRGNQKQRRRLSNSHWSQPPLLSSVSPAYGELRHLSLSLWSLWNQHSTFIINLPESLPPSQPSQLQSGPCDCCLSHLTMHWLALMSLSTRKSRGPSLNRAEGDYATACLWGWNFFFFFLNIYVSFILYFIIRRPGRALARVLPLFALLSQDMAVNPVTLSFGESQNPAEQSRLVYPRSHGYSSWAGSLSFLCSFYVGTPRLTSRVHSACGAVGLVRDQAYQWEYFFLLSELKGRVFF